MNTVTSDTISALAAALAKFQGEAENITKGNTAKITSQKGNFSYTYADLGSILTAIRKPLSKAGLAILQSPMSGERGYELVTKLIHAESGEWAQSVLALPVPSSADVKAVGSAITYARRYALISLLGLATDDDDGSAASESRKRHTEPVDDEFPPDPPAGVLDDPEPAPAQGDVTPSQLKALGAAMKKWHLDDREMARQFMGWLFGREIHSSKELTKAEASRIIGWTADQWQQALVDYADHVAGGPPEDEEVAA